MVPQLFGTRIFAEVRGRSLIAARQSAYFAFIRVKKLRVTWETDPKC